MSSELVHVRLNLVAAPSKSSHTAIGAIDPDRASVRTYDVVVDHADFHAFSKHHAKIIGTKRRFVKCSLRKWLMARTLKAVLSKASKQDSSFYARMQKTIEKSNGFGTLDKEAQKRVLDFFTPEWEARDGRFFPRLDEFTHQSWAADAIESEHRVLSAYQKPTSAHVLANDKNLRASFTYVMRLLLSLAARGLVERLPPFSKPSGMPLYNVQIDQVGLLFSLAMENHGLSPSSVPFLKGILKPEVDQGEMPFLLELLSAVAKAEPHAEDGIAKVLSATPNQAYSSAEIEKMGVLSVNRAAITKALLTLCEKNPSFQRVAPFRKGDRPWFRFAYVGAKVVEVADMPAAEAKLFFKSLDEQHAQHAQLEAMIERAVAKAIKNVLVDHPDRLQMEAIRKLLRDKNLSTEDPAATIRAKLNKKKVPKS